MNEKLALMILNAIPGVSGPTVKKALEHFKSAVEILKQTKQDLIDAQCFNEPSAEALCSFSKDEFLSNELKLCQDQGVRVVTYLDEDYPSILREIHDYPLVLYVKGALPNANQISMAMVGSRKASLYGINTARKFAQSLSELGIPIISGMARGIDTASHQGALDAQGATVAVLGSGLSHIYPPENKDLFEKISQTGAVISEYPMDMKPLPFNFPRRNRIISGLSYGVIIVEAAKKSGALITADCALEQSREVYAIPGCIDNPSSSGVNHLIQQGAKLVMSVEDILEDLADRLADNLKENTVSISQQSSPRDRVIEGHRNMEASLSDDEQCVYKFLSDKPVHIDELSNQSQKNISQLNSILLQLELKKCIKQLPGKIYIHLN